MGISDKVSRGVYVIAEVGCNHGGSLDVAKQMIQAAHWCGVDGVKLQKRDLSSMSYEARARKYDSPHSFGATYGEHREALEFNWGHHFELATLAHSLGMDYGVSTWDVRSTVDTPDFVDWIKVPSAKATDAEFLSTVFRHDKPVVASTGMCGEDDVAQMTEAFSRCTYPGFLLQCTSAYPCANTDVNLAVLSEWGRGSGGVCPTGRKKTPWSAFGLSGHHRGIQIDAAAVALGARVIERHFSLDRTLKGSDHAASLEPEGMRRLCRDVQAVYEALGGGRKRVLPCEEAAIKKLRG